MSWHRCMPLICASFITLPNRGYGGALRSGFASATKDFVFYTDGDAQYDPHEMNLLAQAMRPGVDMVNGYKIERNDPLHRVVIGRLYQFGVKSMFGLSLRDVDCDFRLMRRSIFDTVCLGSEHRRHLRRADVESTVCRFWSGRGAGASLSPRLRQEPVLQLASYPAHARRLGRVSGTRSAGHAACAATEPADRNGSSSVMSMER